MTRIVTFVAGCVVMSNAVISPPHSAVSVNGNNRLKLSKHLMKGTNPLLLEEVQRLLIDTWQLVPVAGLVSLIVEYAVFMSRVWTGAALPPTQIASVICCTAGTHPTATGTVSGGGDGIMPVLIGSLRSMYRVALSLPPYTSDVPSSPVVESGEEMKIYAPFTQPIIAVCVDPLSAPSNQSYYIGDSRSIHRVEASGGGSLIVGSPLDADFGDGVGEAARFDWMCDMICTTKRTATPPTTNANTSGAAPATTDTAVLYVLANNRLRRVEVASQTVTTVAGTGFDESRDGVGSTSAFANADSLCFDARPEFCSAYSPATGELHTRIYIAEQSAIRVFDCTTRELSTLKLIPPIMTDADTGTAVSSSPVSVATTQPLQAFRFNPMQIKCTSRGVLIAACSVSHSLYAVHPNDGRMEKITGSRSSGGGSGGGGGEAIDGVALTEARFSSIHHTGLFESEQILVVTEDFSPRVRCVSLSPHFFLVRVVSCFCVSVAFLSERLWNRWFGVCGRRKLKYNQHLFHAGVLLVGYSLRVWCFLCWDKFLYPFFFACLKFCF